MTPLLPQVKILEPHNVVFAEIAAGLLIFGQKVGRVKVVLETKFGDPSSNRL